MVLSSGLSGQIGWTAESTFGTYAAPTEFHELISESLAFDIMRVESTAIRAGRRFQHRWSPGTQKVTGDIMLELHPVGAGALLRQVWGEPVTSGSGPYSHSWAGPGQVDDKSLTVTVNRPELAGRDDVHVYTGCQLTDWEISAAIDEYVKFQATIFGGNYEPNRAKGEAIYPAGDPFLFTQASVTLGGVELEVESLNLKGMTGIKTDRYRLSATNPERPRRSIESERTTIDGTLELGDHVASEYDRFIDGDDVAINVTFDDGTSSLVLSMNARIDMPSGPNVTGPEMLTLGLPFMVYSGTSDGDAFSATLVNADSQL